MKYPKGYRDVVSCFNCKFIDEWTNSYHCKKMEIGGKSTFMLYRPKETVCDLFQDGGENPAPPAEKE